MAINFLNRAKFREIFNAKDLILEKSFTFHQDHLPENTVSAKAMIKLNSLDQCMYVF